MKNKALFLDRDGVLNIERGEYTHRVEDTYMNADIGPALKMAQEKGFLLIVISNQGGVAKGIYGHADIDAVNGKIIEHLAKYDVELDAVYYCPHHPDHSNCLCRKPLPLLFERAIQRFDVDVSNSLMIGDKQRDVDAALACGIKGELIVANTSLSTVLKNLEI